MELLILYVILGVISIIGIIVTLIYDKRKAKVKD